MKLYDFKQDPELNALRKTMQAEHLGSFELYDPERHLSWQDRQLLAKDWMSIAGTMLHATKDHTLYFKNSAVVASTESTLHFALCDDLKKRLGKGKLAHIEVTTCLEKMKNSTPCAYCLHAIDYQGFDVYRHRHQEYNDKILKSFNLISFLKSRHF